MANSPCWIPARSTFHPMFSSLRRACNQRGAVALHLLDNARHDRQEGGHAPCVRVLGNIRIAALAGRQQQGVDRQRAKEGHSEVSRHARWPLARCLEDVAPLPAAGAQEAAHVLHHAQHAQAACVAQCEKWA